MLCRKTVVGRGFQIFKYTKHPTTSRSIKTQFKHLYFVTSYIVFQQSHINKKQEVKKNKLLNKQTNKNIPEPNKNKKH